MKLRSLLAALGCVSPNALLLALRSPRKARYLVSVTLRELDELRGRGLPLRDVIYDLRERTGVTRTTLQLPVPFWDTGGTALHELSVLAGVTAVLRPRRVFEIGTFSGLTTTVFVLNAHPEAQVITLDLPPDERERERYLASDVELVAKRDVGEWYRRHQLAHRVTQLFGDSMAFDPSPYRDSLDLGFIDGAHTAEYVENDTRKMAAMMKQDGLLLWHDYGGRGSFSGITDYLESLARRVPLYREPFTSLAWAEAGPLKQLLA